MTDCDGIVIITEQGTQTNNPQGITLLSNPTRHDNLCQKLVELNILIQLDELDSWSKGGLKIPYTISYQETNYN